MSYCRDCKLLSKQCNSERIVILENNDEISSNEAKRLQNKFAKLYNKRKKRAEIMRELRERHVDTTDYSLSVYEDAVRSDNND